MQLTPDVQKLFLSIVLKKSETNNTSATSLEILSGVLNPLFDALNSYKNIILNEKLIDFFLFPSKFSEKIRETSLQLITESPDKLNVNELRILCDNIISNYSTIITAHFEQQKNKLAELISYPESLITPVLTKLQLNFITSINGNLTYVADENISAAESILHIHKNDVPEIYEIDLRKLVESYNPHQINRIVYDELVRFGRKSGELVQSLNKSFIDFISDFEKAIHSDIEKSKCLEIAEPLLSKLNESNANTEKHVLSTIKITNELSEERFNDLVNRIKNDINLLDLNLLVERLTEKISAEEKLMKLLADIPEKWMDIQRLQVSSSLFDLSVTRINGEIDNSFKSFEKDSIDFFENRIIKDFTDLKTLLTKYQDDLSAGNKTSLNINQIENLSKSELISGLSDSFKKNIDAVLLRYSAVAEIMKNNMIPNIDDIILDKARVETDHVLKQFFNDVFWSEFQSIAHSIEDSAQNFIRNYANIVKLISLMIGNADTKSINTEQNLSDFVKTQISRIDAVINEAENFKNGISQQMQPTRNQILSNLTSERITTISENYPIYEVKRSTQKWYILIKNWFSKIRKKIGYQIDKLWFRKSEADLISKNISKLADSEEPEIEELHQLFDKITLKEAQLKKIPVYYQDLFLSKQLYDKELLVGREKELLQAVKAIDKYKAGYIGAIMIKGDADSGKSFLSQMIAELYVEKSQLYTLTPPSSGSIDTVDFLAGLKARTGCSGTTLSEIFSSLPEKSVFMLEDIELWWEKSENGFVVIQLILEMIGSFSNKFLFILNCNKHSYDLMNKFGSISNYFLSVIECGPVSAENLKNIVLKRNEICGLKLVNRLNKIEFSNIRLAKLFADYYSTTDGSIGITLRNWLMNINQIDEQTVVINKPRHLNYSKLENLSQNHMLIILQFFLHKRLTIKKLSRILLKDTIEIQNKLNYLERAGIIITENRGTFIIRPDLYIGFKNALKESGLL